MTDPTTDPELGSWVPVPLDSDFPIQNLPYGVFRRAGENPRVGVAIGNRILDLDIAAEAGLFDGHADLPWGVFASSSLNGYMATGPETWRNVRTRVSDLLSFDNREIRDTWGLAEKALIPMPDAEMLLPFEIGDFVDFFSSLEHASNMGRLLNPDGPELAPNWRYLPAAYHGRAGTVVVSGTPVVRPRGQVKPRGGPPQWISTRKLDIELEVGFVIGMGSQMGERVTTDEAPFHTFGYVLVNDWSARDVQWWESVPLGPFLAKSFATSISAWVVTLDALAPYRVAPPQQDPPVQLYLMTNEDWGLDLELEMAISSREMTEHETPPHVISRTTLRHMYWTMPQQLAHATVNGASVRPGDLFASGTVSGLEPASQGSLMELTADGARPIGLPDGSTRTYLQDGDAVTIRGWCGGGGRPRIGFGELRGTILPAPEG